MTVATGMHPPPPLLDSELSIARAWLPVVLGWLHERSPAAVMDRLRAASREELQILRHVLTTQGLGPLIAECLEPMSLPDGDLSEDARDTVEWLRGQLDQNRERLRRFADDLAAILAGAAAAGLVVMPMKGAKIAFADARDPGRRPMADLDLLVSPAEERGLHDVLRKLGYRMVEDRPQHRTFLRPTDRVVAYDATHPDNPRPLEVHAQIRRGVWSERGAPDRAPELWASASETTILGQPAVVPSDAAHVVDVAWHATTHLMRGRGRLAQWIDVAEASDGHAMVEGDDVTFVYPAVGLTARAFPSGPTSSWALELSRRVAPSMVELVASVPLDDRAGLNLRGVHARRLPWLQKRWAVWKPNPWKVRLAFPRLPVSLAYLAYVGGVASYAARRLARPAPNGPR